MGGRAEIGLDADQMDVEWAKANAAKVREVRRRLLLRPARQWALGETMVKVTVRVWWLQSRGSRPLERSANLRAVV